MIDNAKTNALNGSSLNEDTCWLAVTEHDASADGRFFYGVLTTGVYCRPSCPARQPLRKNIRFYQSPIDAERAGLRPCRRCKPLRERADEDTLRTVRKVCDYLRQNDNGDRSVDLRALGEVAGWSPFHLQRTFKSIFGITPKQYSEACKVGNFKRELRKGGSVTDAVYQAGFGSSSRIYERIDSHLGMTPSEYRLGGQGVALSYTSAQTPLGLLLIAATDRGLCFAQFGTSEKELVDQLRQEYPRAEAVTKADAGSAQLKLWMKSLAKYLEGESLPAGMPLDVQGTMFQTKVWRYLQSIPAGEVRSYAEVAEAIGAPKASRAVGSACGANRVAIVIPCHRVIRGNQGLGGYRWGLEHKRRLLELERGARQLSQKGDTLQRR